MGPAYNEFFRVVVEILFDEGRRVHRIEELVHVAQFQTYGVRMPPVRGRSLTMKNAYENLCYLRFCQYRLCVSRVVPGFLSDSEIAQVVTFLNHIDNLPLCDSTGAAQARWLKPSREPFPAGAKAARGCRSYDLAGSYRLPGFVSTASAAESFRSLCGSVRRAPVWVVMSMRSSMS